MDEQKDVLLPVDQLYHGREAFTIIGLTGMAGSGCSTLAELMSLPKEDFLDYTREISDIPLSEASELDNDRNYQRDKQNVNNKALGSLVFKRKYTICRNFAKENYRPYQVVKYTHVLWLFTLLWIKYHIKPSSVDKLKDIIYRILFDKYMPSVYARDDAYKQAVGYTEEHYKDIILYWINHYINWDALFAELNKLPRSYVDNLKESREGVSELSMFFQPKDCVFKDFVCSLLRYFGEQDLYSLCFFHHRLAFQLRSTGEPMESYSKIFDSPSDKYDHLYDVVMLINILIKGIHQNNLDGCRVVIDSLRNSLEARYLKERYTAFYLISVNENDSRDSRIKDSVIKKMPSTKDNADLLGFVADRIKRLSVEEVKSDDYAKGRFASPDIENVIADAEIHIDNTIALRSDKKKLSLEFATMAEQWMKFSTLILHPALITPSAEERCMVVAHTAKLNSSCLSRQVGAVITNQYHSIRTIGWNEVPYGQMPCGLKDLDQVGHAECEGCEHIYSDFEKGSRSHYDGQDFPHKVTEDMPDLEQDKNNLKGLPYSYCFKTLHNRYEGEKNQVFTRSLHAEENAILQMAKYGGEPLMNGVIYVTASPCELCSKKLYQIGVRKIVFIDPYPGIAREQIIAAGFKRPQLKLFQGAYGATYFKLYQPFISYKDELGIRTGNHNHVKPAKALLDKIIKKLKLPVQGSYNDEEIDKILDMLFVKK